MCPVLAGTRDCKCSILSIVTGHLHRSWPEDQVCDATGRSLPAVLVLQGHVRAHTHTHTHKFVNRCLAFCSLKCFLCGQVRWLQHREAASRSERERRGDRHLLLRPWVHRLGGLCDEYPHPRDCQARLPTNILVVSNSYLLDYDFDSLFWYKQQAPKCYKSHNSTSISSK